MTPHASAVQQTYTEFLKVHNNIKPSPDPQKDLKCVMSFIKPLATLREYRPGSLFHIQEKKTQHISLPIPELGQSVGISLPTLK